MSSEESDDDISCDICKEERNDDGKCTTIDIEEWLSVGADCDFCSLRGCVHCLLICYSCVRKGNNTFVICIKCNRIREKLKKVGCKHRTWYCCKKHNKRMECVSCKRNGIYK